MISYLTELVDEDLETYGVPKRDKHFVRESAHILAVCLRASPLFKDFSDRYLALYAVGETYSVVRNGLGSGRLSKPSTVLKEKIPERDARILDKIGEVYLKSNIRLGAAGSLDLDNFVTFVINRNMDIYCSCDDWDNEIAHGNSERHSFI